jgi:hypothetical protein
MSERAPAIVRAYETNSTNSLNGRRERLWLSPACIATGQLGLSL